MKGSATQGFAAKLLDRAAGLTRGLRPRIAPYFAATAATAEPLIEEQSIEQPAQPPAPRERAVEGRPAKVTDTRADSTFTAPPRAKNEPQVSEPRLMPTVTPDPQVQPTQPAIAAAPGPATHRQPVSYAVAQGTQASKEPTSSALASAREGNGQVPEGIAPSKPERQPTVTVPDLSSALAAAVARLTPSQGDEREPGLMPRTEPERPVTATPPPGASEIPALRPGDRVEAPAPLHIHIGEIVIAPNPHEQTASKAAVAPQRSEWQPTLSLEDYREQRRKEGA